MKTLYLAKEPGKGVRDDLSRISGEVVVVDCLNAYGDYYTKKGYNCISKTQFFELDGTMRFDYVIGNPPYQSPNLTGKKGKGGNNSLYIQFIEQAIELCEDGGRISLITPPAGIIKSTIFKQPTPTLQKMVRSGSLDSIDLTVGKHFKVGSHISRWTFTKGKSQGQVEIKYDDCVEHVNIESLYYLPPKSDKIERDLYNKIINNVDGEQLTVVRGQKNQDCTMERFGYPKVQIGGSGVLGFERKFYEFMSSSLGLWLLDYVRRHDQMIYHNSLTGIKIPVDGFTLTEEERSFIDDGNWVNFSRK